MSEYRVVGTKGLLEMNPSYTWNEDIQQKITVDGKVKVKKSFQHRGQVAAEISYFCKCLEQDNAPEPSGLEGLIDVMIIDAIRRSYRTGKVVRLKLPKKPHAKPSQSIAKKPAKKPKPVHASAPSRE